MKPTAKDPKIWLVERIRTCWEWIVDRPGISIFFIALLARVVAILVTNATHEGVLIPDEQQYLTIAAAATDGNLDANFWPGYGESLFSTTRVFMWQVVALFKLFGPHRLLVQLLVALYGSAVAAATVGLATKIVNRRFALVAGLIVAFLPSQILWSSVALRETMIWFCLAGLGVVLFQSQGSDRTRDLLLAATALGLLCVCLVWLRVQTGVLAMWCALPVFALSHGRRWLRGAIGILLFSLLPLFLGLGLASGTFLATSLEHLGSVRSYMAMEADSAFVPLAYLDPNSSDYNNFQALESRDVATMMEQISTQELDDKSAALSAVAAAPAYVEPAPAPTTTVATAVLSGACDRECAALAAEIAAMEALLRARHASVTDSAGNFFAGQAASKAAMEALFRARHASITNSSASFFAGQAASKAAMGTLFRARQASIQATNALGVAVEALEVSISLSRGATEATSRISMEEQRLAATGDSEFQMINDATSQLRGAISGVDSSTQSALSTAVEAEEAIRNIHSSVVLLAREVDVWVDEITKAGGFPLQDRSPDLPPAVLLAESSASRAAYEATLTVALARGAVETVQHNLEEVASRSRQVSEAAGALGILERNEERYKNLTLIRSRNSPVVVDNQLESSLRTLPTGIFNVMVRPLPWESLTSIDIKAASLETALWLVLYILAVLGLWTRSRNFPSIIYLAAISGSVALAGAVTHGNLGTAFRHRGQILFALAVLAAAGMEYLVDRRRPATTPFRPEGAYGPGSEDGAG
jgi:hypothetical protein